MFREVEKKERRTEGISKQAAIKIQVDRNSDWQNFERHLKRRENFWPREKAREGSGGHKDEIGSDNRSSKGNRIKPRLDILDPKILTKFLSDQ